MAAGEKKQNKAQGSKIILAQTVLTFSSEFHSEVAGMCCLVNGGLRQAHRFFFPQSLACAESILLPTSFTRSRAPPCRAPGSTEMFGSFCS